MRGTVEVLGIESGIESEAILINRLENILLGLRHVEKCLPLSSRLIVPGQYYRLSR